MSVGKEEIINGSRVKTEIIPVPPFNLKAALEEPAVYQEGCAFCFYQMTGAGHTLDAAVKGKVYGHKGIISRCRKKQLVTASFNCIY
jgi:hypothetical protein